MSNRPACIQESMPLSEYTTFKIGGPARYGALIQTVQDAHEVIAWARQEGLPYKILGKGGNVLVADQGFTGVVLVMRNDQLVWTPPRVVAGAGVQNGQLIANALKHGLGGLRWLIGVPGTVGGSLYGNAGGHGWGLGDQVDWVDVVTAEGEVRRLSRMECAFAYRTSIFKAHPDWIIVSAQFSFSPVDATAERLLLAETTKVKNANQPTTEKTAGCMFTNPVVEVDRLPEELRSFVDEQGKVAAWRLISHLGLAGRQLGQVKISEKHANFMINLGGGTADQVVQLLSLVKQQVRDKLGVQLREEVQYLGF